MTDDMGPRRLAAIGFSEQFIVWAARSWIAHLDRGGTDLAHLRHGFALAGAQDALVPLDGLLGVVAATARRRLDFRCLRCAEVGRDEEVLIEILAAIQHGRPSACRRGLDSWLPPAAARIAHACALRLGFAMRSARLTLPPPKPDHFPALAPPSACHRHPGSAAVH